jgi:hypothetical protein
VFFFYSFTSSRDGHDGIREQTDKERRKERLKGKREDEKYRREMEERNR